MLRETGLFELRGDQSSDHDEVKIAVSQRTAQPAAIGAATATAAIGVAVPGAERLLIGGKERRFTDWKQLGRLPGQGAGQTQGNDNDKGPCQGLQDAGVGARGRGPA